MQQMGEKLIQTQQKKKQLEQQQISIPQVQISPPKIQEESSSDSEDEKQKKKEKLRQLNSDNTQPTCQLEVLPEGYYTKIVEGYLQTKGQSMRSIGNKLTGAVKSPTKKNKSQLQSSQSIKFNGSQRKVEVQLKSTEQVPDQYFTQIVEQYIQNRGSTMQQMGQKLLAQQQKQNQMNSMQNLDLIQSSPQTTQQQIQQIGESSESESEDDKKQKKQKQRNQNSDNTLPSSQLENVPPGFYSKIVEGYLQSKGKSMRSIGNKLIGAPSSPNKKKQQQTNSSCRSIGSQRKVEVQLKSTEQVPDQYFSQIVEQYIKSRGSTMQQMGEKLLAQQQKINKMNSSQNLDMLPDDNKQLLPPTATIQEVNQSDSTDSDSDNKKKMKKKRSFNNQDRTIPQTVEKVPDNYFQDIVQGYIKSKGKTMKEVGKNLVSKKK